MIVPKQAAVIDDPNALSFALDDVDHFHMCKFARESDHNFELVSDVLTGLVDHAYPQVLAQAVLNGDEEYSKAIVDANRNSFPTNDRLGASLLAAVQSGNENILKLLLDANIRLNGHLNP